MKIIADSKIPFLKGVFEPYGTVEYYAGNEITPEVVKDADALIVRTRTRCDAALLKGSSVKFIATATIGFDHIDTDYCKKNGIVWKNAQGCNSGSVMQYVASVLTRLSMRYKLDFKETTLGIIGVGKVGSKVARMASVLGMKVLLNDPPRERKEGRGAFVSLSEIADRADIITFHVPLNRGGNDNTFHLFNESFVQTLKPGSIIINSSRGEVVSGYVLKKVLKEKSMKAAVLDVWENEPVIDIDLVSLIDIATPHIAGYSMDGKANGTAMSVRAVSNFFNLGLKNWYPQKIAAPTNTTIEIDCAGLNLQQVVSKAILFTYDVKQDDIRLKSSISTFEYQRNNYPVRREFNIFTVKLTNATPDQYEVLKRLGFIVVV
jgi:erythronate-4-phosphate dehydrogenase